MKKVVQYTPADYKILDTLDEISLDNFTEKYDMIEGLIIALNMGKDGNIPLKNQLVMMKNRLVKELSKQKSGENDVNKIMRGCLEEGNLEGALEIGRRMTKAYYSNEIVVNLEKKISHLINLCGDLRGKYSLDEIQSNKMSRAVIAEEGKLNKEI